MKPLTASQRLQGYTDDHPIISARFSRLLPPLTLDEFTRLEVDIIANGCNTPLKVWKETGILLDGHNRLEICKMHDLPYRVLTISLPDESAALIYALTIQLARRNLTQFARDELVIRHLSESAQNAPGKTAKALAAHADTSTRGIEQTKAIIDYAPEPIQHAARTGELSRRRAYAITRALVALPEADREFVARLVDHEEKAAILVRLHRSANGDESGGTYSEILATGGFHYGLDLDEWCDVRTSDIQAMNDALRTLSAHHAVIERDARALAIEALTSSKSNEWFTPARYIDSVRAVLGEIDIDPASCAAAQRTIRALSFYDKESDGLGRDWRGRVFLNPPYGTVDGGKSSQELWSSYLIDQYRAGITLEAILLVNASTGSKWFAPLWDFPICFVDHRIRFDNAGDASDSPTHSNVFVYLGVYPDVFAREFEKHGPVVVRYQTRGLL
jgi:hypothetical protein